jgi:hypothetical protein
MWIAFFSEYTHTHTYGGAEGRGGIAPTLSRPRNYMGVSGQRHSPAALYSRGKDPGTHWTGGWLGRRAGLDSEVRGKMWKLYIKPVTSIWRCVTNSADTVLLNISQPTKKQHLMKRRKVVSVAYVSSVIDLDHLNKEQRYWQHQMEALDLYSGGIRFESTLRHQLSWLNVNVAFLGPFRWM